MPAWSKYLLAIAGAALLLLGGFVLAELASGPTKQIESLKEDTNKNFENVRADLKEFVQAQSAQVSKLNDTVNQIGQDLTGFKVLIAEIARRELVTRSEVIALIDSAKNEVISRLIKVEAETARIANVQSVRVGQLELLQREFDVLKERVSSGSKDGSGSK